MMTGIGCSTIEVVHVDLLCDGIPKLQDKHTLTLEERASTLATVRKKVVGRSLQLQNRITKICADIFDHNQISNKDR